MAYWTDSVTLTLPGCTSFRFIVFTINCEKCPCNVIHDSVTIKLNSTSLIIIIIIIITFFSFPFNRTLYCCIWSWKSGYASDPLVHVFPYASADIVHYGEFSASCDKIICLVGRVAALTSPGNCLFPRPSVMPVLHILRNQPRFRLFHQATRALVGWRNVSAPVSPPFRRNAIPAFDRSCDHRVEMRLRWNTKMTSGVSSSASFRVAGGPWDLDSCWLACCWIRLPRFSAECRNRQQTTCCARYATKRNRP